MPAEQEAFLTRHHRYTADGIRGLFERHDLLLGHNRDVKVPG
jgi:hypothetical protein